MEKIENKSKVGEPLGRESIDIKKVRKKIFAMILPITIESMLQMIAGFISMGMIGRLGATAISSLGISSRIINVGWCFFKGIATGASVFVAQAFGANNIKKIQHVVKQTLLSLVILAMVLQQFLFWNARGILNTLFKLSDKPQLLENAVDYMKIASFGLPFLAVMLVVGAVLQAMGNAKTPMKIAFVMNIFNIVIGYTFIFGKIGISPLGVKGAAIGLASAQAIAAFIGLYILFGKNGVLGYKKGEKLKFDIKQIVEVFRVGFPSSLESMFWQFSAIILTGIILLFGEKVMAAYQLGLQAEGVSYMPATGFGIAATAFIGQSLGAKNRDLGKVYMKELIKGSLIITTVCSAILIFIPNIVLLALTDRRDLIEIASVYLIVMGLVQIPQNISGVLNGALRGAGYTKVPMIVAGIGLWVVRIPFSYLFAKILGMDISVIWVVMGADLVVRFFISLFIYKKKNIYEASLL